MNAIGLSARVAMLMLAVSPAVSITACAQATPPVQTGAAPATGGGPAAAPTTPARAGATDYTLGAGDKLRITVFNEPGLTGEYTVSSTGMVSFPLIGDVAAARQTLVDVQEAIRSRLAAGYLKDPRVAVEVLEYRTFYILGEVNKPGEYPFRNNLTLEQAVATAGGYSYRANRKKFAIAHGDGDEVKLQFKESGQLRVQPGDTIRILERFF
ncbi:MAG: polysaccharide export protein [Sphingomonas adhaesiva]|uniref:polysaccharide biosynthesis/export family protein n=1 Tax=Sphingomonas adhaesiva TaxID=28212 RepID=UPI002FFC75DF